MLGESVEESDPKLNFPSITTEDAMKETIPGEVHSLVFVSFE